MRKVVELTLGWAMLFGDADQKQKYIDHIFTLKPDHQQALMLIIQEQQELAFGSEGNEIENDNDDVEETTDAGTPHNPKFANVNAKANASDAFASGSNDNQLGFGSPGPSLSPFGNLALASPAVSNRRVSASAFSKTNSPYQRLAVVNSGNKSARRNRSRNRNRRSNIGTPSTSSSNSSSSSSSNSEGAAADMALLESLRGQLKQMKTENLRLHTSLTEAETKLTERDEERKQLAKGSEKRAAELKKVMRAEMAAIERETELTAKLEDLTNRNKQLMGQAKELASLREQNRKVRKVVHEAPVFVFLWFRLLFLCVAEAIQSR